MPEVRTLVIGLDNAGKTTLTRRLLQHMRQPATPQVVPTIGLETHQFKEGYITHKIFDLGGNGHCRDLWEQYVPGATNVLIVIDAADNKRLFCIRDEIQSLVNKVKHSGQRFLIVANKSDLKEAVTHEKITLACKFDTILKDFSVRGCNCSALLDSDIENVVDFVRDK